MQVLMLNQDLVMTPFCTYLMTAGHLEEAWRGYDQQMFIYKQTEFCLSE